MSNATPEKHIETRPLDQLKPHPKQNHIFQPPTATEIKQLADLMQSQPSTTLVEVLPDGTIICGHSRVQAARSLGWTEIEVWVRDDLEAEGTDAVLRRLINDNYVRRQLSPLDKARCIKTSFELDTKGKKHSKGDGVLRERIGAEQNMSGRNLERYLNVLKTPMEVQAAFDQKKLSLDEASRVSGLKAVDQRKIAEAITQGETPRDALKRYLKQDQTWKVKPDNGSSKYLRSLKTWQVSTKQRLAQIASVASDDAKVLRAARNVIDALLRKVEPQPDAEASVEPKTHKVDEEEEAVESNLVPDLGFLLTPIPEPPLLADPVDVAAEKAKPAKKRRRK